MLAGILPASTTTIPVLQISQPLQVYLKNVTSDASWGKDSLWVVTTGAQLRLEEEAKGARRMNSEQGSALGVATRLYRGEELKHLSF